MSSQSLALAQLQSLLGTNATDDALWRDLRQFEGAALPAIDALWELDRITDGSYWHIVHPRDEATKPLYAQRVDEAVRQIHASLGDHQAGRCAAAFFLSPQLWQPAYTERYHATYYHRGSVQSRLLEQVAQACLKQRAPADWVA